MNLLFYKRYHLLFIILFFLGHQQIFAQTKDSTKHFSLGISVLGVSYKGDLVDHYKDWGIGTGIHLQFHNKTRLSTAFQIVAGSVSAENPYFTSENNNTVEVEKYFKTNFTSFYFNLSYYFIKRTKLRCYISPGIGLIRFSPKNENNQTLSENNLSRLPNETFGNTALALPIKIGIQYYLPNGWMIHYEANWLMPRTDYIDNIGQLGNSKKDQIFGHGMRLSIPFQLKKSQNDKP